MPNSGLVNEEALAAELEADLVSHYGLMLTGESLKRALGYRSLAALQQALSRGTVPVPVFAIENRRGKYALAKDVARWLAGKRAEAVR